MDVTPRIIGQVFDLQGNMHPESCEDDVCQSVLVSAAAASEFVNNTEAELCFTPEVQPRQQEKAQQDLKAGNNSVNKTIRVPSASYVCSRTDEYWATDLNGNTNDTDASVLEEITERKATIQRGDVIYLPMGKDDVLDENILTQTNINMSAVVQHAPSKWCQVLSVDLLFARLWVRPCSAAPQCWLDYAMESGAGRRYTAGSNGYWLPVSLLWDAVVFSPEALPTTKFSDTAMCTGKDVVKSVVKNGVSSLECKYCAFNVPSLSSSEAIAMLRAISEMYPAVGKRPNL